MTILGKILVFVNLIFSVLVGGLVVVVFTARVNYAEALKKSEVGRELDRGLAKAKAAEVDKLQTEYNTEKTKLLAEKAAVEKDLEALRVNYKSYQDRIKAEVLAAGESEKVKMEYKNDVTRARADVVAMQVRLDTEIKKNTDLALKNVSLTQDALTAQIEARALDERLKNMEAQLQTMARELAKRGGTFVSTSPGTSSNPFAKNPPTEKIDAQVVRTLGTNLQLSVGSDSGLRAGQTLELYRLSPKPLYLGTIRITDVEAKVAVATPITKLNGEPQVGDKVASQIK